MRQFRIFLAAVLCILPFCSLLAEDRERDQRDQQIVYSFFPSDLAGPAADKSREFTCFKRLDRRTIVAGYSYHFASAILLLKEEGQNQYKKAFQVNEANIGGGPCGVDLLHLSDDRHAPREGRYPDQVAVGFLTASVNSQEVVFDVEDDKLIDITPMDNSYSPPMSDLCTYRSFNGDLIDYYQDGTHQILSEPEYPPRVDATAPKDGLALYRLVDGKLQVDTSVSVVWAEKIDRTSGSEPFGDDFPKPTSLFGPFVLHIANGDWHGEHRVKRATILLNGIVVASLGRMDGIVEFNVNLQEGSNQIEIRTGREGDEEMSVAIVEKTAQSAGTP